MVNVPVNHTQVRLTPEAKLHHQPGSQEHWRVLRAWKVQKNITVGMFEIPQLGRMLRRRVESELQDPETPEPWNPKTLEPQNPETQNSWKAGTLRLNLE